MGLNQEVSNLYTQEVLEAFSRANSKIDAMWIREAIKEVRGSSRFIVQGKEEDTYLGGE